MTKLNYPTVKRNDNFIEQIHGVDVADPYRWLENENDEEVKKFCEMQQNLTMSYIQDAPDRENIKNKLTKLWNYPKFDAPFKRGDYYYMFKNSGLQNQNVVYRFKDFNDEHEVFLDPNTFSDDGSDSLNNIQFSKDAKFAAYSISLSGSDWLKIKILNVETKEHLDEELIHCKFTGISWTHDNKGFFYSRYEKSSTFDLKDVSADTHHKLYYHRINTKQIDDILVHSTPCNPKFLIVGKVSDCGDYLFITQLLRCRETLWYYVKLKGDPIDKPFIYYPIVDKFEGYEDDYITNVDNFVYFKTNRNAPNYKICRVDLNNPNPSKWVDIVPEDKKKILNEVICVDNNKLALIYMVDVIDKLEIKNLEDGSLFKNFNLPIGTINSLSGRKESNEIFVLIASFLSPGQIFHYNFSEGDDECKLFSQIKLDGFDPNEYVTKQEFFTTKDEKWKIPIFVVHHKDVQLDSNNPCILYGYGGFSIAVQPGFSVKRLVFMKYFKGVYAIANIRGGCEYGSEFYNDGKLLNKQNCFDDFIQGAELLIEKGYTNKNKLAIEGGSNGGLLVAAVANQRPELFGAVICHVGVLDLLRFHLFTIGSAWTSDYGDRTRLNEDGKKDFENQFKLSPLHNIPENCEKYPATLVITSDHDNRVSPLHSFKFISELQYKLGKKTDSPLLLRVDIKSGHGQGRSTEKVIGECVDIFCFLQKSLGLQYYP